MARSSRIRDRIRQATAETFPPIVIIGLDPRIGPRKHLAGIIAFFACREILGSSPRMTARGKTLAPRGLILTQMRSSRPMTISRRCDNGSHRYWRYGVEPEDHAMG